MSLLFEMLAWTKRQSGESAAGSAGDCVIRLGFVSGPLAENLFGNSVDTVPHGLCDSVELKQTLTSLWLRLVLGGKGGTSSLVIYSIDIPVHVESLVTVVQQFPSWSVFGVCIRNCSCTSVIDKRLTRKRATSVFLESVCRRDTVDSQQAGDVVSRGR